MKWNKVNDDGCSHTAMTTITCAPFFFFALLLGSLIVEFVEGPTVEGTDDDDLT